MAATIRDEDLMFSDEEYQELFGEMLCSHYVAQGMDEVEAAETVLQNFLDPKWKMDIAHQVQTKNEVVPSLRTFFEAVDADRIGEADEICDTYFGTEDQMLATMEKDYPDAPEALAELGSVVEVVEARAKLIEKKKGDGQKLDTFLRKFFLRIPPWDGVEGEDKAAELLSTYYFRKRWTDLYDVLKTHYPKALELTELANYLYDSEEEPPQLLDTQTRGHVGYTLSQKTYTETQGGEGLTSGQSGSGGDVDTKMSTQPKPSFPAEDSVAAVVAARRPEMTRKFWLESNAKIAKHYYRYRKGGFIKRMTRNVGLTVAFRVYYGVILLLAAVYWLAYAVHFEYQLLWKLFTSVPVANGGFLPQLGLVCMLWVSIYMFASFLTTITKTLTQWVFLDDAIFFGDVNFAKLWEERVDTKQHRPRLTSIMNPLYTRRPRNPVPLHLTAVLPPHMRLTVFGLPTSRNLCREWYLAGMILFTTVIPLFYAVIRSPVEGQNIFFAVPYFIEWCVGYGIAVHAVLFAYAWSLSVRSKYRAYYEWRKFKRPQGVSLGADPAVLPEWGMDQTTVGQNSIAFFCSLAPVIIMFWMTFRSEAESSEWSGIALAALFCLFIIREVVRDVKYKQTTFFVVTTLIFLFVVMGIVGNAKLDYTAVLLFLFLVVVAQGFTVPHRVRATKYVDVESVHKLMGAKLSGQDQKDKKAAKRAAKRAAKGDDRVEVRVDDDADARSDAYSDAVEEDGRRLLPQDKVASLSNSAVREVASGGHKTSEDAIPLKRLCLALCNFPCCPWSYKDLDKPHPYPHFANHPAYYGSANTKSYQHPLRKVQQSVSVPVMIWFMLLVLVCSGAVIGLARRFEEPTDGGGSFLDRGQAVNLATAGPQANPILNPPTRLPYPVCSMGFGGLSITDMAILAELSYYPTYQTNTTVARMLSQGGYDRIHGALYDGPYGEQVGENSTMYRVIVTGYRNTATSHVVLVVRSNLDGRELGRDLDIWGDSLAFQALAALIPVLNFFDVALASRWVATLAAAKRTFDGNEEPEYVFRPLIRAVEKLQAENHRTAVTLVGHGTNGGIAAVVGALTDKPVVAFSPPGSAFLTAKYDLKENPRHVTIVPAKSEMASIDQQVCVDAAHY